jgi:hypothetical protein
MKNRLAMALEPEMTRLDDAGVHRTDSDFVNLFTLHPVVLRDSGGNRFIPVRTE